MPPLRAGVIGDPVLHSRSPAIHLAAAEAVGVELDYRAIPVTSVELPHMITHVRETNMRGLSVTMPHKHAVISLLDEITPSARELAAVNHITNTNGRLVGNNTDGEGFLLGLQHEHDIDVAGMSITVVGAGGAARAIIRSCALAGARAIDVLARNPESGAAAAAVGHGVARLAGAKCLDADLVVNATPIGMAGGPHAHDMPVDVQKLTDDAIVVDIVYTPLDTPFLVAARARRLRTVDGLAMLAGQAAAQFSEWTGVRAPLDVMMAAARVDLPEDNSLTP